MSPFTVCMIVFACVFGGALLGMLLRAMLPETHLSSESKDVIRLGMGLVATMAALVLSLLIASAKNSFDTQNTELVETSAKIILLDRMLAHYGPETNEARGLLRASAAQVLELMWKDQFRATTRGDISPLPEQLYDKIQSLAPKDEGQRIIQSQALNMLFSLGNTRWLAYEQGASTIAMPMLILLVLWLMTLFISFGMFAPFNATVLISLLISSLSVSGAILLILELYSPYTGLIQINSAPLRNALSIISH